METTLLASTTALLTGALTPGPNNFIVLRQAALAGWRGAALAIAGIVAGGLALFLLVAAGVGALVAARPGVVRWVALAGAAYLVGFGLRLLGPGLFSVQPNATPQSALGSSPDLSPLPTGPGGLFVFQFLNPKAWLLTLTVTAQAALGGSTALSILALLYLVVPTVCLVLWSAAGRLFARALTAGHIRLGLDRAMGVLLIASAAALISQTWSSP